MMIRMMMMVRMMMMMMIMIMMRRILINFDELEQPDKTI